MKPFQKVATILAVLVVMVTLGTVAWTLHHRKSDVRWPPVVGECPDYWEDISAQGNGSACKNRHRLGTCNLPTGKSSNTMDFTTPDFASDTNGCQRYTWAQNCGVTWDGITYGVANPCAKPSH
jgi:hypothetical protein